MLKKELAVALGISGAMVTKLAKRGMPTDSVDRAKRWRKRHLQPGMVKGFRAGTTANAEPPVVPIVAPPVSPPPAWPQNWANITAPEVVDGPVVEAVGAACGHMLKVGCQPNQVSYAVAFLRDLMRKLDPDQDLQVRLPLCVWIALTDHGLHPDAKIRLAPDHELHSVFTAEAFGSKVNEAHPWPWQWLTFARDEEGISVFGWPDEGQDEDEE